MTLFNMSGKEDLFHEVVLAQSGLAAKLINSVGERGLEPPASRSQTERSSQLSYSPAEFTKQ